MEVQHVGGMGQGGVMDLMQWLNATVMSKDTCAVLTAVFPIVLLTAVLERRAIHVNIRRQRWFRRATQAIVTACAVGLVLTVIGVEVGGLASLIGVVAWMTCGIAILGLPFTLLAALATAEAEEDRDTDAEPS